MERWIRTVRAGAVVFAALGMGCGQGADARPRASLDEAAEVATEVSNGSAEVAEAQSDTIGARALSAAFRRAAQRVLPAVVYVQVEKEARNLPRREMPLPDPFRRFFEFPGPDFELPPQEGTGSGFIFDDQGHILTNNHVVDGADRITVRLEDGQEYDAEVVGTDATTDVAVIKIDLEGRRLPVAPLGDSDALQIGDWVLALGNPLGLDFTVTAGIVSAKGRHLTTRATALESYIQTDAAINPGNSGGPLIDLGGRVVGISSAIYGGMRFVGYGFAVPVNLARRVVEDLLEFGYVKRPRLGVSISDVTAVDAEAYGLETVAGAEVNVVTEDGPGEKAGLEIGDVIVALNGEPIRNATDLTTGLARLHPGDRVTLAVMRDGKRREVQATLDEFPRQEEGATAAAATRSPEGLVGFSVQPLTRELADRYGYNGREGVMVSEVARYSSAAAAGVRPGQLVRGINGQRIRNPGEFRAAVRNLKEGDVVSLRVVDPDVGETIMNYRLRR